MNYNEKEINYVKEENKKLKIIIENYADKLKEITSQLMEEKATVTKIASDNFSLRVELDKLKKELKELEEPKTDMMEATDDKAEQVD